MQEMIQSIERVLDKDGNEYSISEAYEKEIDWVQIDKGFLFRARKRNSCWIVVNMQW